MAAKSWPPWMIWMVETCWNLLKPYKWWDIYHRSKLHQPLSTAWGTAPASWLSASRTGSAAVSARIPGMGWCQGRGLWFLYSISSFLWSLNIFENQQLQLFFPHCLMCFFRGTIGIIYQTYIHKIWIAVWFSKNLLTKFDIVWSYFEPFYFRQSGNWRVPQGRSQGSMTDQGGDTITHTQVLNCRCRVCTWFVTGLYPVTNPK